MCDLNERLRHQHHPGIFCVFMRSVQYDIFFSSLWITVKVPESSIGNILLQSGWETDWHPFLFSLFDARWGVSANLLFGQLDFTNQRKTILICTKTLRECVR